MIVQNDGAEKLTTQRIADIAGVNIASLYQYFPSKEAVLARVFETEIERMAEAAKSEFKRIEALSYQSFEGTLVAIIQLEASQLSRIHGLGSDFYLRYRQSFDIHERVNQLALSQSNLSWESWFVMSYRRARGKSTTVSTSRFFGGTKGAGAALPAGRLMSRHDV